MTYCQGTTFGDDPTARREHNNKSRFMWPQQIIGLCHTTMELILSLGVRSVVTNHNRVCSFEGRNCRVAKIAISRHGGSWIMIIVALFCLQLVLDTTIQVKQQLALPYSEFNRILSLAKADPLDKSPANQLSSETVFIDKNCRRIKLEGERGRQIERLLMILKCDAKPLISIFERLVSAQIGNQLHLVSIDDLLRLGGRIRTDERSLQSWREYLGMSSLIEHFYTEAQHVLSHMDFCSYTTISRLGRLKSYVLGSKLLSHLFDLLAIEYHTICLDKALNRLPQVPYLVREVVDIYRSRADKSVLDLNSNLAAGDDDHDDDDDERREFNVDEAIARHGPLEEVVPLLLFMPTKGNKVDQEFRQACKEFLIDIDERWQSIEMMSQMLHTANNGIKSYSNLVLKMLTPMRYAQICGQLSGRA